MVRGMVAAALLWGGPLLGQTPDSVTASGDSTRRPSEGGPAAARTVTEYLLGRLPGVLVYPSSGTVGTGARVRIRGSGSLVLPNEPALYLDGIRVEGGERGLTINIGGQEASRLDDLNLDDIDSIVVVRGPASGVGHGAELATGALHVYTRQGRPGRTTWRAYVEEGRAWDVTDWPASYGGVDADHADSLYRNGRCTLQAEAQGLCVQDYVRSFAPLDARDQFRAAPRRQYGIEASGGTHRMWYAIGGEIENQAGVYELSRGEIDRLEAAGLGAPGDVRHPSNAGAIGLRATAGVHVGSVTTVTASLARRGADLRFPYNDNSTFGLLPNGLLGWGDSTNNDGWRWYRPGDAFRRVTFQEMDRFVGSVRVMSRPTGALELAAVAGLEELGQREYPLPQPYVRIDHRAEVRRHTFALDAALAFALPGPWRGRARLGGDRHEYRLDARFDEEIWASDSSTLWLSNVRLSSRRTTHNLFVEQEASLGDRFAAAVGLRLDDLELPLLESFTSGVPSLPPPPGGAEPGMQIYPAVRLWWAPVTVPRRGLDRLALRFGYGEAGRRIGPLDPERTGEAELGAEAVLWGGRARVAATGYARTTWNGVFELVPGLRTIATGARVTNRGLEVTVEATPLVRSDVTWDVTLVAWGNRNRVARLPGSPLALLYEGSPLGGYWAVPIQGWSDANGDGIIAESEILMGTGTAWMGSSVPTQGAALRTGVFLFGRARLGAQLEYRAGHHLLNYTAVRRCFARVCPELHDRTTPLARQAAAVAASSFTDAGYFEDADFLKLRELSLVVDAPAKVCRALGARTLRLTLAGRNLATWTGYSGFDPEVNANGQQEYAAADFFTQPPLRFWTLRVDVEY